MSRFQVVKGMLFPKVPWFKKEDIEVTLEYVPKDDDIIIASYPKTGTTWLQYIVLQITPKGESFPSFNDVLDRVAPFMEMAGPEAIDNLTCLRMYKHHYRYDMVKKNPKVKALYIHRNSEDTFTSFFHFLEHVLEAKLNLEEFLDGFFYWKYRIWQLF
ncbi:hypothetical protein AVEN_262789-1 [Araneus ventricosus]|uniref:Sulfotransferase domain-containing protein n=1 Tax=Araneus ventricosus TaxID=182803 RepID=A0A4Y2BI87_ARAVE|nr:hypothetical protein AVEN_262789-1 [Araneus ventricosus]